MNQGNCGQFATDDGVFQDGGLIQLSRISSSGSPRS